MSLVRNSLPAIVAFVIVLAFGLFGAALVTRVGYLAVPSAIGGPYALPGLRVVPLGETTWLLTLADTVLALALVGAVASARGGFWRTWGAFLVAAIVVNLLRAALLAMVAQAGLGAYLGYLGGGLLTGLIWGIVLGWIPGLAALPRRRGTRDRSPAGIKSMG
ncbi:hypothetical protein ACIBIZ_04485 [Nonomuraea spiralis]|uniref:DUF4345 domain-containing protein n=1 Tax=Nonomuraea spiralis TaxID=46182 RepID=A0ABV5IHR1_9ACTN|nr:MULTISPECIES: hypothetical protein [Nonomuraea]